MHKLIVKNLNISYKVKEKYIDNISDINFVLNEGDIIGIVGESGSGKSTIAKSILNILPSNSAVSGEILYDGKNLLNFSQKDMEKIRGNEISMIFQDPKLALNPIRKLKYQFYDILIDYKKQNGKSKTDELIIKKLLDVNLKEGKKILTHYPFELSGGMAQRVVIAMSLIKEPSILIADEPTASIDAINRKEILNEIIKLKNMSKILISHNLNEVYNICNKLIVLYNGKIVEQGNTKEIFKNPKNEYTKELLKMRYFEGECNGERMFG